MVGGLPGGRHDLLADLPEGGLSMRGRFVAIGKPIVCPVMVHPITMIKDDGKEMLSIVTGSGTILNTILLLMVDDKWIDGPQDRRQALEDLFKVGGSDEVFEFWEKETTECTAEATGAEAV